MNNDIGVILISAACFGLGALLAWLFTNLSYSAKIDVAYADIREITGQEIATIKATHAQELKLARTRFNAKVVNLEHDIAKLKRGDRV